MNFQQLTRTGTNVEAPDDTVVWDLTSDEAGAAIEALSSDTARDILACLYDEPRTASAIAESLDHSLQNVNYHVQKLITADVIEVAEITYSQTGREMKIYAPTANAVLLLSKDATASRIRTLLSRVFAAFLLVGIGAMVFRSFIVGRLIEVPLVEVRSESEDVSRVSDDSATAGADSDGLDEADSPDDPATESDSESYFEMAEFVETVDPLEHLPLFLDPGVTFFLGAVVALLLLVGIWWVDARFGIPGLKRLRE